ncbi:MAG TPA: PucR family transcriptional regulator [Thermomonospora sp.]|nr:PucR family transcriptional regulator [Thermomonospora sp.]
MTRVGEAADLTAMRLPDPLVALIRGELPDLADEIVMAVRRDVPGYGRPLDGACGQVLRSAVRRNLAAFTDYVAGFAGGAAEHAELCRDLGRLEAREGRTMDRLQAAYRIGGRVAWRRFMRLAARHHLPPSDMSALADALFRFLDGLATMSVDGFLEARARSEASLEERRRTLLRRLLADPPEPGADLVVAAGEAGWPLPSEVTPVALEPGAGPGAEALDRDVLADLAGPEPCLLVPGALDEARRAMLVRVFPGRRLAAGLTVPVGRAADSLRWARRSLELATEGVIDDAPVTLVEDHLMALWLTADPALTDRIAEGPGAARDPFAAEAVLRARALRDRPGGGQPSDGGGSL